MQHYITPPKYVQSIFSKKFILFLLVVAGFSGFSDMSQQHNKSQYAAIVVRNQYLQEQKFLNQTKQQIRFSHVAPVCRAICNHPPEKEVVIPKKVVKRVITTNQPGTVRLADIKEKPKNPNSIRISLVDAPVITAKTSRGPNGKLVGHCKGDKTRKSKKNSKGHVDTQCCLDPDEIPNPRCAY